MGRLQFEADIEDIVRYLLRFKLLDMLQNANFICSVNSISVFSFK